MLGLCNYVSYRRRSATRRPEHRRRVREYGLVGGARDDGQPVLALRRARRRGVRRAGRGARHGHAARAIMRWRRRPPMPGDTSTPAVAASAAAIGSGSVLKTFSFGSVLLM